jgi:Major tropism determinant N-terminal domain
MPAISTIQIRRGLASAWTSANPILASGEFGYETDTGQLKVGDASTHWNSLGYFSSGTGSGGIDFGVPNSGTFLHIETTGYDTSDGLGILLHTANTSGFIQLHTEGASGGIQIIATDTTSPIFISSEGGINVTDTAGVGMLFSVYGTGSKIEFDLEDASQLLIHNLPTTDPGYTEAIWNDGGTLVFSGSTAGSGSTPGLGDVLAVSNGAAGLAITGLADPTNPQDAATKAYADSLGGGGGDFIPQGTPGTISIDTSTYTSPYYPYPNISTLVDSGYGTSIIWATAEPGDAFPRMMWFSDPVGRGIVFGDGTNDAWNDNGTEIYLWNNSFTDKDSTVQTTNILSLFTFGDTWAMEFDVGEGDDNLQGAKVVSWGTIQLGATLQENGQAGSHISSWEGNPNAAVLGTSSMGGYVNDLYIKKDAIGIADLLWVCTTPGISGTAVWESYFNLIVSAFNMPFTFVKTGSAKIWPIAFGTSP